LTVFLVDTIIALHRHGAWLRCSQGESGHRVALDYHELLEQALNSQAQREPQAGHCASEGSGPPGVGRTSSGDRAPRGPIYGDDTPDPALLSQGGTLTPAEVQSIIIGTTTDLPDDPDDNPDAGVDWDGAGMVNFQAAVQKAQALTAPPPTVLVPGYSTWSLIMVAALMTMFTIVTLRRRLRRT